MDNFKIDDVAKECGLTKRTIRYYEEIGLLSAPDRSDGGTRLYTRDHIDQLKQIVNARDVLGFTLQEIQDFVSISNRLAQRHQEYLHTEDVEQKRQDLQDIERIVARQLEIIDQKLAKIADIRQATEVRYQSVQDALNKLNE
ncbi:MerR family transcriptional regulator [Paenibacillus sp. HWE-109]|uniref:helix-turn-helix domain-containing protein n=1 Tax=Paenibacillus sp. HWE-109 TaxID=1306526 RepID=UPI001EDF7F51|nr:MerR family transcriptional regulator [Paenibacillus sp. HWE-109]UKS30912.1 MerR family transcriptional regulator [Paenibacillus sp. HWE-109]